MMSWRVRKLDVTSSTNDEAKNAAEAGEAEGLVVWALEQTKGRGRQGRVWESPEGNLFVSVLLRPQDGLQNIGFYSFIAALALSDTVRHFVPQAVMSLKWPNDVLVEGKKISGILLESGPDFLVMGMGLNVLHYPKEALYPCTSLRDLGAGQSDLSVILNQLLTALAHWYAVIQAEGFTPIREEWLKRAQKGRCHVRLPNETVEGDFLDLDIYGRLRLRLADGSERAIATGDVFFLPKD